MIIILSVMRRRKALVDTLPSIASDTLDKGLEAAPLASRLNYKPPRVLSQVMGEETTESGSQEVAVLLDRRPLWVCGQNLAVMNVEPHRSIQIRFNRRFSLD